MRQRYYKSNTARAPKVRVSRVFETQLPDRGEPDAPARPWQKEQARRPYTAEQVKRWLVERVIRLRMLMARKHCSAERRAKLARKIKACG